MDILLCFLAVFGLCAASTLWAKVPSWMAVLPWLLGCGGSGSLPAKKALAQAGKLWFDAVLDAVCGFCGVFFPATAHVQRV